MVGGDPGGADPFAVVVGIEARRAGAEVVAVAVVLEIGALRGLAQLGTTPVRALLQV